MLHHGGFFNDSSGKGRGSLVRMSPAVRAILLLLSTLLLVPYYAPVRAQSAPQLLVTPGQGRPGDWFYIAGGGFPPGKTLQVYMYCPDYFSERGRWVYALDPSEKSAPTYPSGSLKATGSFAGWRVGVPTPYFAKSTPCVMRAANGPNPVGVAVAFKILPDDGPRPSRKIPIVVRPAHTATRLPGIMALDIHSAPGAHVAAKAYLRSGKVAHYSDVLPWTGHNVVRWKVGQSACGSRLKFSLKARLGDLSGQKSFLVMSRC